MAKGKELSATAALNIMKANDNINDPFVKSIEEIVIKQATDEDFSKRKPILLFYEDTDSPNNVILEMDKAFASGVVKLTGWV